MKEYEFYISNKNCKQQAKEALRYAWKESAIVTLLFYLFDVIFALATILPAIFVAWWIIFPLLLVDYIFWSLLDYGYNKYFWQLARLEKVSNKILFCGFSKDAGKILGVYFKKLFLCLFWFVCLIVPYFFKSPYYAVSHYLIMDRPELKSQQIIKESKHLMTDNTDRYAKFQLKFAHWYLLMLVTGFVGGIWILPYLSTCKAVFYEDLKTDF